MASGPPRDELDDLPEDPRRQGAHRARPSALRRVAPVLLVLALAVLAALVVTLWFDLGR
ncbi:hypothetical protein [uncultured Pseudokineococcus sp.]|uniref:hypothetical protein n=1 Tax=uncultured Pseudokineococcus sp. TaxID=1642928 RepID=UPI0026103524|nr:hypothetical protein [uncultured Pseudokineococcus sp.]